ncbi:MAG: methyltransferase domain-containing protein [Euryarchaeota archaeon]|nr:methyltransferase domain-containing protein [Euryarchaeota archaeon]
MRKKSTYIHGTSEGEQERLRRLNALTNLPFVDFLSLSPGEKVLDVGCGLGTLARDVATKLAPGSVTGVEFSLDQLRARPALPGNVRLVRGDAHALPFGDDGFDVAYCRYLLEHVPGPVEVLREMRRVLKVGGRAMVQENNILATAFDPDCEAFDRVWARFATLQERLGGDALIGKRLYGLFRKAGFKDVSLSVQPELHHVGMQSFAPWVENLIDNLKPAAPALEEHGLASREEVETACEELSSLLRMEHASALFYWNRASAVK